jgi:hypothetical protein
MINVILKGYLQAARFTESNQSSAIRKETVKSIKAGIEEFIQKNGIPDGMCYSDYGNNLWYSRNGHGAGFFAYGYDRLQEAARILGPDDALISELME